jgi:hypothetical protein
MKRNRTEGRSRPQRVVRFKLREVDIPEGIWTYGWIPSQDESDELRGILEMNDWGALVRFVVDNPSSKLVPLLESGLVEDRPFWGYMESNAENMGDITVGQLREIVRHLLGIISDFTSVTELMWLKNHGFSVASSFFVTVTLDSAWLLVPGFGYLSDYIPNKYAAVGIMASAAGVGWYAVEHDCENIVKTISLLSVLEILPAAGTTIINSLMVSVAQDAYPALPQWSRRVRYLGKTMGALAGSQIPSAVQDSPQVTIFRIQRILCFTLGFLCYLGSIFTKEPRKYREPEERSQVNDFDILTFTSFLVLTSLVPSSDFAVTYFLSSASFTQETLYLLTALPMLASVGGTFIVKAEWSVWKLSLISSGFWLVCLIPILFIKSTQDTQMITFMVGITSIGSAIVESSLSTTYSQKVSHYVAESTQGFQYALLTFIPTLGKLLGVITSWLGLSFFHINHDDFSGLAILHLSTMGFVTVPMGYGLLLWWITKSQYI